MIDLKPACRRMTDVLAGVDDAQLNDPTPCTEYTVHGLIDHIDEAAGGLAALARGGAEAARGGLGAAQPDGGHFGDARRQRVAEKVRALGEAWDDPAAWSGATDALGVELANELWGRIALTEMVVHGWDLAKATGQPYDLPRETLQACFEHVRSFVPRAPVEGLWGPSVEAPAHAPLLDRLVAVTGRRP
ncbi:TIGR03086 family protein [Streptomyces diacarni]|uniref:TIGR03086 family protein n=1 Tax=Streptomyces diacarni TaxID=2800381 RepID=A0A367F395_9ACTN|nr:TIGR03086 family metal-binding protein [Streptomyces diacarni]RCG24844.1 TIGR03086 family protein [Streptomyces diacarni]